MTDEYTTDEADEGGSSRRDALKKIGVAAGVVWATPVVMSLSSPAGANAVGSAGPNPECRGAFCGTFTVCSSNTNCLCATTPQGGFCLENAPCPGLATCGDGNTCPAGFVCGLDTCCVRPVCIALPLGGQCPPPAEGTREGARVATRESTGADTVFGF